MTEVPIWIEDMDQKYDGVFIGREADNINKVYILVWILSYKSRFLSEECSSFL